MEFKDYITEMAYRQSFALEKTEELLPELSLHIVKFWTMPDSREIPHWTNEVTAWLRRIKGYSKTKTDSGVISKKAYDKEFSEYFDISDAEDIIFAIESEYGIKVEFSSATISKNLKQFFGELWDSLSGSTFSLEKTLNKIKNWKLKEA